MKILIADDDRLVRTLLSDVLAGQGHEVVSASDGNEAVELCLREQPDAVILDFLMPRLSGIDALARMRQGGRRVPAVLLTAISGPSVRDAAGSDAPEVILEKPFDARDVARALARVLRAP
ncbi:MAG TPA: response regulator [Anaeromyxobacteraceae bacterium]|nr:response regulator [Anaeromyxobacteraceae bacterium]